MGIWWALRLVGLLDERNVVEWSVLRCYGQQRNCPKHAEFHSKNKFEK